MTISVFSKVADPDKTVIEANKISISIKIVFENGKSLFERYIHLKDVSMKWCLDMIKFKEFHIDIKHTHVGYYLCLCITR